MTESKSMIGLGAGSAIRARGSREACLSGWVIDRLDRIYGLTARHALLAAPREPIEDLKGVVVGREIEFEALRSAAQPVEDCIARFRVADAALITAAFDDWDAPSEPRDVDDMLGQRVYKIDRRGTQPAQISEVSATAALDHDGQLACLDGVAFLEPTDPNSFGEPYDAGSLIVDTYGAPVGILLGGQADSYAFAPLREWLEMAGLRFITAEDVAIHNRRATEPVQNEADLAKFVSEIAVEMEHLPAHLSVPSAHESQILSPEEGRSALARYLEDAA